MEAHTITPGIAPAERAAFIQKAVVAISLAFLAWAIAGLIANPDFATGEAATSKVVLGVDFNGWHALSGMLLAVPGVVSGVRSRWSALFALYAAFALTASGVLALTDRHPAGLVLTEHGQSDFVMHIALASLYLAAAAVHFGGRRA